jgi:hypothetical protein
MEGSLHFSLGIRFFFAGKGIVYHWVNNASDEVTV